MNYEDIRKQIRESMGLPEDVEAPETLTEAFVAQPKKFDLNTDKLSQKTKMAHTHLYDGYVKCFNESSAELDGISREDCNPIRS